MRLCCKCQTKKHLAAFVGKRGVCRACFYYLSEEEKRLEISYLGNVNREINRRRKLRLGKLNYYEAEKDDNED